MPPINGFMAFARMKHFERKENGEQVEGVDETIQLVGEEWLKMSADERKPYEDKAKLWVSKLREAKPRQSNGADATGNMYAIENPFNQGCTPEAHFAAVNSLFEDCNPAQLFFVVMSCNYFCHVSDNPSVYVPAEIGITAFSIKSGVIANYWTLVDPGALPNGKTLEGKENWQHHKIPLPPFDPPCESRYQELDRTVQSIQQFLIAYKARCDDWVNIFCLPSETLLIEGCLNWLMKANSTKFDLKIKVQELPRLFFRLNQIASNSKKYRKIDANSKMLRKNVELSSIGMCNEYLSKGMIGKYEEGLACPFHDKVAPCASMQCALLNVNCLAMAMLGVLGPKFHVEAKPGYHVPFDNSEDQSSRRDSLLIGWGYLPSLFDYSKGSSTDAVLPCKCSLCDFKSEEDMDDGDIDSVKINPFMKPRWNQRNRNQVPQMKAEAKCRQNPFAKVTTRKFQRDNQHGQLNGCPDITGTGVNGIRNHGKSFNNHVHSK